jgi:type I restriction enzyme R subunit
MELSQLIGDLFAAIDDDNVEAKAYELTNQPVNSDLTEQQLQLAQAELVSQVANVFTGDLIEFIDTIRREKEQKIDLDNLDSVTFAGWTQDAQTNAKEVRDEFMDYLENHKDEIDALSIFYHAPHRRRELTYSMIHALVEKLKADKPKLSPLRVWQAYSVIDNYQGNAPTSELTALVALIRRVCQIDETLVNYEDTVRRNFQNWIMTHHAGNTEKFSPEQMAWLHMIRDHIASSIHIERDDLEMSPFDGKGGLGKMYQLFGSNMDNMFDELNQALAA